MKNTIRKFALLVVNDFDEETDRFNLDYVDTPRNLGFELEFTTLESRLTTYFTSAREKKSPITLNVNFLPPNAYLMANAFKAFIQKHMQDRLVFEYNDTTEIRNWEGKVQKLGQDELQDWGGLICPISFIPGTPKYIKKDNVITIKLSSEGKSYPIRYPYNYGKSIISNNRIANTYFDEIPLRVTIYGSITNPQVSMSEVKTGEVYSSIRFKDLHLSESEHVVIDAIQAKVMLYRNGHYISAYDFIDQKESLDSFLYAKENTESQINISLIPSETGYLKASYRQYVL